MAISTVSPPGLGPTSSVCESLTRDIENQEEEEETTIDVSLTDWEDLAIASNIAPDLQRIADAVG